MTGRTHDLGAFTALVIAILYLPALPPMSLFTAGIAFGANFVGGLFPDIDQTTSDFWDNFRWGAVIAKIVCPLLGGHRNISHSLFGFFLIAGGSKLLLELLSPIVLIDMSIVWSSFMIGVFSHLLLDLPTKEGLPLFWPLTYKVGIPPFKSMRMKSDGFIEHMIVFPGLLLFIALLMYHNQEKLLQFLHQYVK